MYVMDPKRPTTEPLHHLSLDDLVIQSSDTLCGTAVDITLPDGWSGTIPVLRGLGGQPESIKLLKGVSSFINRKKRKCCWPTGLHIEARKLHCTRKKERNAQLIPLATRFADFWFLGVVMMMTMDSHCAVLTERCSSGHALRYMAFQCHPNDTISTTTIFQIQ